MTKVMRTNRTVTIAGLKIGILSISTSWILSFEWVYIFLSSQLNLKRAETEKGVRIFE